MKVGASAFNTDKIHTFVCCLSEAPFGFNKHTVEKLVPLSEWDMFGTAAVGW